MSCFNQNRVTISILIRAIIKWKKDFTQVKRQQFPYMYEVTKYASAQPFFFAKRAFEDYCKDKQEGKTGCME